MGNIEFTKLVASGNDFIIVDNREEKAKHKIVDFSNFAKMVCQRKHSIGADGLLLVENSRNSDIAMRIFNPDGHEVTMCGNGSRCVSYYAATSGITRTTLSIETRAGILRARVSSDIAKIEMTQPKILRSKFSLEIYGQTFEVNFVNTGVPHIVCFVDDLEGIDV
jgi:diaminopimelate epimerase